MGEIANYFARERYIRNRLSLLVLVGFALLVPAVLASATGRISRSTLEWAFVIFVAALAIAVVLIVRGARVRFPRTSNADDEPLDMATQRKLRRRIRFLQGAAAFYAIVLCYGVLRSRDGAWLPVLIASAIYLLLEVALIKAIRRLKTKLNRA